MISEIWKECKGFSNYEVSNFGNVRSKDRIVKCGKNYNACKKGKILSLSVNSNGYLKVVLSGKTKYVHILVGIAFIDNPENKREINHIDDNKRNNFIFNLEWVTSSENKIKAYKTGIMSSGENRYNSKLTNKQIIEIRNSIDSPEILSKKYKVTKTHILRIINNKRRKHG
jgi:hypothetical protein